MIRSTFFALGLLGITSALTFAAPIPLGAMSNFAVFSSDGNIFNNNYSTGTTTIYDGMNAGSRFAFGGADAITFNGGGSYQTVTFGGTEYTAFHSLTSTLSSVGGTAISSWVGLTPGDYTFDTAPTSVTLNGPGTYVFTYTGSSPLSFSGVNITLGSGVSSDDVIWYVSNQAVSVLNSVFAGVLVVDGTGAFVDANGGATSFNGRILAESTIALTGWNGGDLAFNNPAPAPDPGDGIPEPSSVILVASGLAVGGILRRRFSSR